MTDAAALAHAAAHLFDLLTLDALDALAPALQYAEADALAELRSVHYADDSRGVEVMASWAEHDDDWAAHAAGLAAWVDRDPAAWDQCADVTDAPTADDVRAAL